MNILSAPVLRADRRIAYGPHPSQFGDLWLPASRSSTRWPLVVFFHGGWWKSEYDLGYAGHLCAALKHEGIAAWSVEYRRVGSTGGGWPFTFHDVAAGFDFVSTLAKEHPLDLSRILAMGHSAGGHLAFWVGGRPHIPELSELFLPRPAVYPRAVIALAGAVDLRLTIELAGDGLFAHDRDEVYRLMGGTPQEVPERYQAGNPGDLLPLAAPQVLIQGSRDDQIPPALPQKWAEQAKRRGSHATVRIVPGADHFDVVDPTSEAWGTVMATIQSLLSDRL